MVLAAQARTRQLEEELRAAKLFAEYHLGYGERVSANIERGMAEIIRNGADRLLPKEKGDANPT
jgi:hypothetical protein